VSSVTYRPAVERSMLRLLAISDFRIPAGWERRRASRARNLSDLDSAFPNFCFFVILSSSICLCIMLQIGAASRDLFLYQ
jgi:hypothetical protein